MSYVRPQTVEEARSALDDGGTLLAGGTVVVPRMARGESRPRRIVDLSDIEALSGLEAHREHVHIGAMVTLAYLAASPELRKNFTALVEAVATVGNPQVRCMATIGGNLAVGPPVADLPQALLALDAVIVLLGQDGEEQQPVAEFLSNRHNENRFITAIRLPRVAGRRSAFVKFAWRRSAGKTIVNVAASLRLKDGKMVAPRLVAGGLTDRVTRLAETEQQLDGQAWREGLAQEAAQIAAREVNVTIARPPAEQYRRRLVQVGIQQLLTRMSIR